MIKVALKGLTGRPLRTVLTLLAIVVGVATITAAYTLSDTQQKGADALTSAAYDGTAAVVSAKTSFKVSEDSGTQKPTVDQALLQKVRSVPQVGAAVGDITDLTTKLVDAKGDPIGSGPYFGEGIDSKQPGFRQLTPFRLKSGRWATRGGEVVIDAGTAKKKHYAVGDTIRVAANGPARPFRVVGVATFGSVKSIGTATFALFDASTARRLEGKAGRYDAILVGAKPGESAASVRQALRAALPSSYQVQTAAAHDRFTLDGLKQFVKILRIILVAFGAVAVFVGAFTIFNTLSITVAQRTREFGLLRMVGAGRRQVLGSVVTEAFAIGIAASLLGLAVGYGLASVLNTVFASMGLDLPQTGTVVATRTIVVALVVGTLVTVLAGLVPAWRATRIQPVAALRDAGADGHRVRLPGRIVRALTGVVGRPAQVIGGAAGTLARRNAMRNPGRVISTALALTIGLALVTTISVLGQGLKDSTSGQLERQISASRIIVDKDGYTPISPAIERAAAATPGVRVATSIRQDGALAYGNEQGVNSVDPAQVAKVFDFKWKQGDRTTIPSLGSDGAVIDSSWAKKHHLGVGGRFQITSAGGTRTTFQVRGVEASPVIDGLGLGPITISRQAAKAAGLQATRNRFTLVDAPSSADAALKRSLAGFPEVRLQTKHAYIKDISKQISSIVSIFNILLALAVIVSLFGLVNALVLATFERTRELGMLRAVGMTRRQVRRMVRHESVITAVIGAIAGIAIGFGIAGLAVAQWGSDGLSMGVPVGSLVAFVVVAVIAGVVAAVLPARRAARLDVLSALAYE